MDQQLADPSSRIVKTRWDETEVDGETIGRLRLTFTVEDLRGDTYEAQGRVLFPSSLRDEPETRLPLVLHCGYEASEEHGAKQVALGRVSATTVQLPLDAVYPNSWSLLRGPKMEFVLGHLVRSLGFVDPAKVIYTGGSAGGYSALLAASAAFPAAACVPGVPPTNLAYMGALWAANFARLEGTDAPSLPWFTGLKPGVDAWQDAFGADFDAPAYLAHSPVADIDQITCPVLAFFSASDPLVPIEQVDHDLAAPIIAARPGEAIVAAAEVTDAAAAQVRLLDALGDRADVHVIPLPEQFAPMLEADLTMLATMPPFVLPAFEPLAGKWSIVIADEGEPVWVVSHFKHQYEPDFEPFIVKALAAEVGVGQLNDAKLAQLLDRYAGTEWFASGFHHLDRPEAEQADVERGLRAYCAVSSEHRSRFRELYDECSTERKVLPASLLDELGS